MPSQRNTRQKAAILETLAANPRPLSREDIFAVASRRCSGLGERTVYRILAEMVADGRLMRVQYPGQPMRYELPDPRGGHHPHFICRKCDQVFVLPDETPEVIPKLAGHPDFAFEGEEIIIFGACLPERCPLRREEERGAETAAGNP